MVILGLDPGTATTGVGIVQVIGNKFKAIRYGAIITTPDQPMEIRLQQLYDELIEIIEAYKPDQVAVEKLFFNTNITTGITVAQARGVLLLACAQKGLKPYEYTPLEVKQALVGNGRAEKKQVQFMVKTFLGLQDIPKPDDAADGLAIAICHAHYHQTKVRSQGE